MGANQLIKSGLCRDDETASGNGSAVARDAATFAAKESEPGLVSVDSKALSTCLDIVGSFKSQLDSLISELAQVASCEARRVEEIKERYEAERAALQIQLKDSADHLSQKDQVISELEQRLNATVGELENEVEVKRLLLQVRGTELAKLEWQIQAKEEEILNLRQQTLAEILKLSSELKQAKITLASYEQAQWHAMSTRGLWRKIFHRTDSKSPFPSPLAVESQDARILFERFAWNPATQPVGLEPHHLGEASFPVTADDSFTLKKSGSASG
jgi:hypothetical protein